MPLYSIHIKAITRQVTFKANNKKNFGNKNVCKETFGVNANMPMKLNLIVVVVLVAVELIIAALDAPSLGSVGGSC